MSQGSTKVTLGASTASIGEVKLTDGSGNAVTSSTTALAGSERGLSARVVSEPLSPTALSVSSSGDNTIFTPDSGEVTRAYYISLSADGANSADVTAIVKFGAGGSANYKVSLKAGAIFARNIGAGKRHMQGATNEALIVNLSAAQTVHVSVEAESV